MRNLDVTWFFYFKYQCGPTDLYTSAAQEHLRSDALTDTTAVRRESNTGPFAGETDALPIAPRPLPVTQVHNGVQSQYPLVNSVYVNFKVIYRLFWLSDML